MPILECLIPEKDPPFLGGSAGNGAHPPASTVYGRLPRPRELPPIVVTPFNDSNIAAVLNIKSMVETISTGKDLSIHWTFDQGILSFKAYYTGNNFTGPSSLDDPLIYAIYATEPGNVSEQFRCKFDIVLCRAEMATVVHRVLHLFLRLQGSSLDYATVNELCKFLRSYYAHKTNKKWNVLLDLAIVRADVAFSLDQPNEDITIGLRGVAEALEAREKFKDAAVIYQDIVDTYASTNQVKEQHQAHCAMAWKCAGDYMMAEEAYVKALCLRSMYEELDLSGPSTPTVIINFVIMYSEWNNVNQCRDDIDETRVVCCLFLALLHCAGFQPLHEALAYDILLGSGPSFEGMLATQFKSKSTAKQAFVFACSASTAPTFRSRILSCKDPNLGLLRCRQLSNEAFREKMEEDRKQTRKDVRRNLFATVCSNPECAAEDTTLNACPCKKVKYCGKSCQLAHWKEHKRTCAYLAEKKKSKK